MVDLPNIALFHEKERYGNSNYPTQDPTIHKDYETFRNDRCTDFISNDKPIGVNDAWNKVKTCLLISVDQVCGWNRGGGVRHAKTWWWDHDVDQYITKSGDYGNCGKWKEDYLVDKKCVKRAVYNAKKIAQEI